MQIELTLSILVVAVAAFCLATLHWRRAVYAVMFMLIFEGALRKWVLPEAQVALYLAKDVLLIGAYTGFVMAKGFALPTVRARPLVALLVLTAFFGAIQMLNPSLPSLIVAAVGWRAYFVYVPLVFVVPHLFRSPEDLHRALRYYALVAIPVAALGLVQFYSPIDSEINALVQHDPDDRTAAVVFGEQYSRARVASTFSFVSGFGAYLIAIAFLLLALLAANSWRFRGNVLLYCGFALILAAMFATGSRAPVYSVIGAIAVYFALATFVGDLRARTAIQALTGAAILAVGMWSFLPEPVNAFQHRVHVSQDAMARVIGPLVEPVDLLTEVGPLGFGIGAAHQSAPFLLGSRYPWWTQGIVTEEETSRITLELGIIGLVLVLLFRIGVTALALRAAFSLKSRQSRSIALAIGLFLGIQIFGAIIFNPTMNVLYWFAVGTLFALYRYSGRDAQRVRDWAKHEGSRVRVSMGGARVPLP